MRSYCKLTLLFSLIFIKSLYALETDQYLAWGHEIRESSAIINRHINSEIRELLKSINQATPNTMTTEPLNCSFIVKKVFHRFRPILPRRIEHWIEINKDIDIYPPRTISSLAFYKMSIYGAEVWPYYLPLTRTINMNGIYIGVDKFSHFFLYGLTYYNEYLKALEGGANDNEATISAILKGVESENGIMGKYSSAVFSFADLEANFQGFLFAKNLCEKHIGLDPLTKKFKLKNEVDMNQYISPNWDESYYNSAYFSYRFVAVKPYLMKYCLAQKEPWVVSKRAYYLSQFTQKGFSLNYYYLKILSASGAILNQNSYSLDRLCTNSLN
ncbi:MAG: hypothetical protein U0T83_01375 [Bacteriovoracaceae bacterium]